MSLCRRSLTGIQGTGGSRAQVTLTLPLIVPMLIRYRFSGDGIYRIVYEEVCAVPVEWQL